MSTGLAERWPQLRHAARKSWGSGGDHPLEAGELARAARAIERLSLLLTRQRERVDERYLEREELLAAYFLFYWPVSYAQARSVLGEVRGPLGRALDLGAGPLPMSWAALDAGATSVLALERVGAGPTIGAALAPRGPETRLWEAGAPLPDGPFDTIVAGHLLNELFLGDRDPHARRAEFLGRALRKLSPGGRLVVIEPALRDTSRDLLALRDLVIAGGATVLAPCLMQAVCPARIKPTDWCHAERAWTPPSEHVALAEAARIHKDHLKMSYLVLAHEPAPVHNDDRFRVVSEPLDEKGKLVRVGCGPRGRHRLVLRERDLAEHNRAFGELARGDVVRIAAHEPKGDGLRIAVGAVVDRIAVAGAPPPETP